MSQIDLGGLSKLLIPSLVGKIKTVLKILYKVDVILDEHQYQNNSSIIRKFMVENTRLLKLSTPILDSLDPNNFTRDDAIFFIAHNLIWKLGLNIYGGFVRDWVIRGNSANDIDTLVPGNGDNFDHLKDKLVRLIKESPFSQKITFDATGQKTKGKAYTLVFKFTQGKDIEVDFVSAEKAKSFPSPGASADVDNLCINSMGQLVKKADGAGGNLLPLSYSIQHCLDAKFVFFYRPGDVEESVCKRRLEKLLQRNWTCIGICGPKSDIQNSFYTQFQNHRQSFQLQDEFCRDWNTIS